MPRPSFILTFLVLAVVNNFYASAPPLQSKKFYSVLGPHHTELKSPENSDYLYDRVIVKIKTQYAPLTTPKSFGITGLDKFLSKYSITSVRRVFPEHTSVSEPGKIDLSRFYVVTYTDPLDPFMFAEELSQQKEVEYAEPWFIYSLEACTPNDPSRSMQWALNKVLADSAWCIQTGDTTVIIGIIDTGIQIDHPDIFRNIWINPGESGTDVSGNDKRFNNVDDDGNGKIDDWRGWDFGGADYSNPIGDNKPVPTASNNAHGTHVAGIASAHTNNGIGVAGISYNCKLLAVKTTSDNDTRGSGGTPYVVFGFEGIVYAADLGAHVINCSWGGGGASQFEQEIINYAVQKGAIVVASAGNEGTETPYYPASYDNVLSVAATKSDDRKSSYSQYGAYVDVCAPGDNIYSTMYSNTYAYSSGTSMASPLAAGLVALVKSRFPHYTMLQAAEQVRVSCDNIDALNSSYVNKLGRGRLNAFNALTVSSPSVRFSNLVVSDSVGGNNNGIPERNESIDIWMTFTNYLSPLTSSATATLTTTNTYVQITSGIFTIGTLNTMQSVDNSASPFKVTISNTIPMGQIVNFKLTITDVGYTDVFLFPVIMNPNYNNHTINNVKVTLTHNGRIGYNDFPTNSQGVGFIFGGANHLFEGGLLIGTSATKIVDVVRNPTGSQNRDFTSSQIYQMQTPGTISDQDGSTVFTDASAPTTNKIGLQVSMFSYGFSQSPHNNYIILRYDIQNTSGVDIYNLYAGLFFDWDIQNYSTNKTWYDNTRKLGYAWDAGSSGSVYCGTRVLEGTAGYRALVNDANIDLSRAAKFGWLSGGVVTNTTQYDIHYVVSAGPFSIPAGAKQIVAFALIGGTSLTDLKASADAALSKWNEIKTLLDVHEERNGMPTTFALYQNYPNPFNPVTVISYQLPVDSWVKLKVYDMLGREMRTLVDAEQQAGYYKVQFDASKLAGGVYFYKLTAGSFTNVRKMLLLR